VIPSINYHGYGFGDFLGPLPNARLARLSAKASDQRADETILEAGYHEVSSEVA
jgi:hypothetical protein